MASTSNEDKTFTVTSSIKPERSEITHLTWEVEDDFINEEIKMMSFEAGKTIQIPCSWDFEVMMIGDDPIGLLFSLDLELKKGQSVPNVLVAYEVAVDLTRSCEKENAIDTHRIVTSRTSFSPKSPKLEKHQSTKVYYDSDWTLKNVHLRMEMFNSETMGNMEAVKMEKAQNTSKNLTLDSFKNLLQENDNFSDFKMKMPDGKEFRVHKAVLASRSPVFSKMFTSNMQEAYSGTMEVVDLSSEVMEVILKLIYSGSMDEKWKNVIEELIYAGDKYELKILMEFCDTMLVNACNPQNAIEILKICRKFKLNTAEKDIKAWILQKMTTEDVLNASGVSDAS